MEQKYPLTKQQEALWVEWKLHPNSSSFNTCVKLRMEGDLDVERFHQALKDIVSFFSSLRVYFVEEKGVPFQAIKEQGEFTLDYHDISIAGATTETPEQRTQGEKFLEDSLRTPIDLKSFPIIRAGLMKTTSNVYYFIGLVPHMISDGASAILFLEAASTAYNKGYAGLEEAYGDNMKDWNDYFSTNEHSLDEEQWQISADYWQNALSGAQHSIDFNAQHSTADTTTGKRVGFDISAELSQQLKDYARSQRTTMFNIFVAAFGTLTHRLYGQEELVVGYPVNIRPRGYKNLFGFFVNIIPMRTDLSGDPTFSELLARTSTVRKADKKHQTFPALDIVRTLRKQDSSFDGRVFNVSIVQTISRLVNLSLDGIVSEPLDIEDNDVNDDLTLTYEVLEDGTIGLWYEYRESLFTEQMIDQLITQMQSLLEQIVAAPEQPLSHYRMMSEQAEQHMREQWSHGETLSNPPATMQSLFEHTADASPERTALLFRDTSISYGELNAQSNQLANQLHNEGLNKGDRVALFLERGPQMIQALLAVLKAGCCYIPIPPDYPAERIDYILNDAHCQRIITQQHLTDRLAKTSIKPLTIDGEDAAWRSCKTSKPEITITADDAAYTIYTSGSTGKPKGVLLNHGNTAPCITWMRDSFALDAKDTVLQNTDYSFDVSIAEIFWPLSSGASLVLIESEKYKDPSHLIDLIKQHNIAGTCLVPSLLSSILSVLKDRRIDSFKHVLSAGEALPPSVGTRFYAACSGDLYNVYGPTEAAIYASYALCPRDTTQLSSVPIGRPVFETSLYILDQYGNPSPQGVSGELHIGGSGVAQGYVNLPDITAEQFISDLFSKLNGSKLYKTGDLCRFDSEGHIEYLGRIDAQVKIRGFRIELGEIESSLLSHSAITDAAVIDVATDGTTHKRLAAYYVAKELNLDILKAHIASQLPAHMHPAFYIPLDEIPRLPSGKINRRALPRPEQTLAQTKEYVAPRDATEKTIVAIWADILKVPADKIGIYDSFFELGGDSLMAIQFACAAEEEGIAFDTNALFTRTTIAELSEIATTDAPRKTISQDAIEGSYPLLPRQAKFFADNFAQPHHWNRFFMFDINHEVNLDMLKQSFDTVLTHHDNMRVSFAQNPDGQWQQHCSASLPDADYISSHDVSSLWATAQDDKIIEICNESHASLSLDGAPLLRVLHFNVGNGVGKLAIIAHHLLLDIVSSRIIFEDFIKSYEGLRLGIAMPLAAKTSSVQNFTNHLQIASQESDLKEEITYWSSESMTPSIGIAPDNKTAGLGTEGTSESAELIFDTATTQALLKTIPASYGSDIQTVMLMALQQTFQQLSDENNTVINICGHGRTGATDINLSRTVGWLNTVYPVHLSSASDTPAAERLAHIKAQLDAAPTRNEHYNLLRYSMQHPDITQHEAPSLFFNYVSQIDALIPEGVSFQPVIELDGIRSSHPDNKLGYGIYIEAGILDKQLHLHTTYSNARYNAKTIKNFHTTLKNNIAQTIETLIEKIDSKNIIG